MTQQHPDLPAEQAYIDHAYDCLNTSREAAWRMRDMTEADLGGTFQARFERNAFDEALVKRLTDLDLGNASLVFGRIDRYAESPDALESFHIGRLAVADEDREPVVVDWRAPVAEPFYRATGRDPMGIARRRHFAVEGQQLLGIEDELFGEGHLGVGHDEGLDGRPDSGGPSELRGYSTLLASLERGRTGTLGDIVATIQGEQDEIIRSPQAGVLVVQGGPGTGKTVVALHRAAYLLYTHRFPLEDQGVLVIGPNRVFLRYIERVLPSLGEAGIAQVVLADLVPGVEFLRPGDDGDDSPAAARLKGDAADVRRDRSGDQRPSATAPPRPRAARSVPDTSACAPTSRHGSCAPPVAGSSATTPAAASSSPRCGRRWPTRGATTRSAPGAVREVLRGTDEIREALDRMWPVLTPAQLLHDLFGSKALAEVGRPGRARRRRGADAVPRTVRRRRRRAVDGRRRRAARRRPRRARPEARQERQGRRARRDPHVRPHRHRRGAGPHADAAEDGDAPLAQRFDDDRRRHRPGDRTARARPLGRRARLPARPQAGTGHRAVGRLPHSAADHGTGEPGDGARHAVAAFAAVGPGRRRTARRSSRAASTDAARRHRGRRGR